MMFESIVPQSAGSLSVAVLALMMCGLQIVFLIRKPHIIWYGWSAAISFSGLLYAVGIFFEYNTVPGPVNRFAGLLEFTAHLLLIQSAYGFTFTYLGIRTRRYHLWAGLFHTLVLILLWSGDLIVAETSVSRHFGGLAKPYLEPALGPLGPLFELYVAMASIGVVILWLRNKGTAVRPKGLYLAGIIFWIVLGIHDGLASLGMPTFQYIMEYGFFGFSAVILWGVFNSYVEITAEDKYRVITEWTHDGILVIQDGKTVFGNPACQALFGRPVLDRTVDDFLTDLIRSHRLRPLRSSSASGKRMAESALWKCGPIESAIATGRLSWPSCGISQKRSAKKRPCGKARRNWSV
jgi:PAS domain-containing protein